MTALRFRAASSALPLIAAAASAAFLAAPAAAQERRSEISPYVEIDQSVFTDLSGDEGTETFTTVAAGVALSVEGRRVSAQADVRYQHSFAYDDDSSDVDNLSGVAQAGALVAQGLTVEAGGLASRTRVDGRGGAGATSLADDDVTNVYSGYVGPTYSGNVGTVGVNAAYRFGYTGVDSDDVVVGPGGTDRIDYFDDSKQHLATASIGQLPGPLPVGWQLSGSYYREDQSQLDGRIEDYYARGDLTVPVSATLAIVGGAGYEKVEVSERDVVRDPITGVPVVGSDGRFVTDRDSPRLASFTTDGLLWDVGVLWRPSARTSLEARVGERYGSTTYYGSFSWAANARTGVNVSVYDRVSGFGGLINDAVASLGGDFDVERDPFTGDLEGCAIGDEGAACFGSVFQGARSASFRARGVTASVATRGTRWSYGAALGYQNRKYYASDLGGQALLAGTNDEVIFAALSAGRPIGTRASLGFNAYANAYNPALGDNVYAFGANATYGQQLLDNLTLRAALGIDAVDYKDIEDDVTASGLVGLRYGF